jgi:hypothetical protein
MSDQKPWISHSIDGRWVNVALRDGTRIDDCQLVSSGRSTVDTLWLFANGEDLFVPVSDVTDLWEAESPTRRAA